MTDPREQSSNVTRFLVDRHIASTLGDAQALAYGEKRYSYTDIAALMNRAGNMFRNLGVARGERVLLLLQPSPAFFAGLLGAMKIGAVPVLVADDANAKALAACIAEAKPAAAIVESARLGALKALLEGRRIIVAGPAAGEHPSLVELLREAPSSLAVDKVDASAAALMLYGAKTSATVTHGELAALVRKGGSLPAKLGRFDLAAALGRFFRCEEVTAAPAA